MNLYLIAYNFKFGADERTRHGVLIPNNGARAWLYHEAVAARDRLRQAHGETSHWIITRDAYKRNYRQ